MSVIILFIVMAGLLTHNSDILLSSLFFVFFLLFDLILLPDSRDIKLMASRRCEQSRKNGQAIVNINLEIKNLSNKSLYIHFNDTVPKNVVVSGTLSHFAVIKPGEITSLTYSFEAVYGVFSWNQLVINVSGPLGCFQNKVAVDGNGKIIVQPQFKKIGAFKSHPWKTLSSQGIFQTARSGVSTDFFGVREYHPGDSLKNLYWKLSAKHPGKFFTKEFVQEQNASITLVVDVRRNMEALCAGKSIFDDEINLAAALSEMFLNQGNQVGLSIVGLKNFFVRSGYGKRQLHRILNGLAEVAVKENIDLYSSLFSLNRKLFSPKTQYIFISPFHFDDIGYYRYLRSLGYQIILICPDIFDFTHLKKNAVNDRSLRMCKIERKLYLDLIAQMSIRVIDWKIDQAIQPVLKNLLTKPLRIKKM
ncbi:MAG: DUF58 domain-containing protein [Spirochaetales bacterium]|nr:DUF58 domain-containing protein [Spirochaetales bacterium]